MTRLRPALALKALVLSAGVATASAAGYAGLLVYNGNLHVVSQGVLYRSAQLSKGQFIDVIQRYKIRSILNLRGAHPGQAWYDDEIAATRKLAVEHYDIRLSATRRASEGQIRQFLQLVHDAPKPLLIHCQSGADRTGLVAALFRFVDEHARAEDADAELSLAYGHFPYLTSRTVAMDESFWWFVRHSGSGETAR